MKLTVKQELFAQQYVLTGNASEAYRESYPKSKKWKDSAVYAQSSKLLANSKVLVRVEKLRNEVKVKFDVSAERLVLEQSRIALFDFRKLFNDTGQVLAPKEMPDEVAAAVSSVKVSRAPFAKEGDVPDEIIEVKLWSKNTALESLFKNKGLYSDDNSQKRPMVIVKDFAGGGE